MGGFIDDEVHVENAARHEVRCDEREWVFYRVRRTFLLVLRFTVRAQTKRCIVYGCRLRAKWEREEQPHKRGDREGTVSLPVGKDVCVHVG